MTEGIRVKVEGSLSEALREAIRLRGQVPQPPVAVTILSPTEKGDGTDEQETQTSTDNGIRVEAGKS